MVRIPKRFHLHGYTVNVEVLAGKDWPDPDAHGLYEPDLQRIRLRKAGTELLQHTFLHELTHAVLTAMGRRKLNEDEEFVDAFSALLHQALTSAEYK